MINLTREEAEQVLKLLDTFDTFNDFTDVREPLRAKLSEYPKKQVLPHEFSKAVEGKEDFVGMPIIWAEWPTKESSNV